MSENVGAVSLGVNLNGSDLNSQVSSLGSSVGATFRGILSNAFSFALGQGLFSWITTGFKSSIEAGWDFDSTMQSATTSFTTLLHSASGASSLVSQLNAIDQVSTLDMTDLSKAAQEMISFGVNSSQVIPTIKELGDISQGNSEKFDALALAFSQTSSAGKLTGQDLLQYISAGFNPLQIIAQKTGKSMADLRTEMENGQISAQDVADAFKTATSAGGEFYNATANASKTVSGQMPILSASVTETLGAMIKPAFTDFTSNVLPHLISVMGTVSNTFSSTGSVTSAVGAGLKAAFGPQVSGAFTAIAAGVKNSIGWIAGHGTLVITVLGGIVGAMTAFKVATAAVNTVSAIQNTILIMSKAIKATSTGLTLAQVAATKTATGAQIGLNVAMLANPITWIVVGIAALVAAFVVLWIKCSSFRNFWIGLWNGIKTAFSSVWSFLQPTIINGVRTVSAYWNMVWPKIKAVFVDVWSVMKPIISLVIGIWKQVFSIDGAVLISAWNLVWTNIKDIFKTAWDLISGIFKYAWDFISGMFNTALDTILGVFRIFKDIFTGNWSDLGSAVKSLAGTLWNDVTGIFKKLFNDVKGIFGNLGKDALQWGKDIIMGIVNGIKNAAGAVGDAVKGVAQDIRSFLHFSEPDEGPLVGYHGWWKDMMQGAGEDIAENSSYITGALQAVTGNMSAVIKPSIMTSGVNLTSSVALAGTNNQTIIVQPAPVNLYADKTKLASTVTDAQYRDKMTRRI